MGRGEMPTKKETFGLAVCDGVRMSHPPGAVFQARLLDNGANGAIPNDTASEKSRRYVSNVDLFLVPTLFQLFQLFQLGRYRYVEISLHRDIATWR